MATGIKYGLAFVAVAHDICGVRPATYQAVQAVQGRRERIRGHSFKAS
jgi:hypothetical protein